MLDMSADDAGWAIAALLVIILGALLAALTARWRGLTVGALNKPIRISRPSGMIGLPFEFDRLLTIVASGSLMAAARAFSQ
jgi:hypothetical protein